MSCNLAIPRASPICRQGSHHLEPFRLWAFIFIIHFREPSVIVQRQILCGNSPDVTLGALQYFGGNCCDWLPLWCLQSWCQTIVYLRPVGGDTLLPKIEVWMTGAERPLSSSPRVNQQLPGRPRVRTQLSAVSTFEPQLVLTPHKFGVLALMFMNRLH